MSQEIESKQGRVQWDPARYQESMAAIKAWVPAGVTIELEPEKKRIVIKL